MLTRRRVALALTTVAALGSSALAVQPPSRTGAGGAGGGSSLARRSHDVDAVVLPAAGVTRPLRTHVDFVHQVVPAKRGGDEPGMTQSSWDRATGVPSRIWGKGLDVPGSVADPDVAAAAAWRFLVAHLDLVAPGASVTDFELVANVERNGLRTIGFIQRHGGLAVFGGQVSFRFKNDRLFVVGSEALPDVRVEQPRRVRPTLDLRLTAAASTAVELGLAADRVSATTSGPLT
ncbi:MAG: hypothetical protein K8M05_31170, partial [Deltaproteobacteria bacterium]|nr:hypothetical protein [Kofleriaceae bacterium]